MRDVAERVSAGAPEDARAADLEPLGGAVSGAGEENGVAVVGEPVAG